MSHKPFVLLAVLAVAACAHRYEWTRKDTPAGEIELARNQCAQEAGSYGFLDGANQSVMVVTPHGERYASLNANTAAREYSLFNDCMRAKGYTLAPIDNDNGGNDNGNAN